jgi:serine/tyrosine/threonine adenylyltransferase
MNASSSSPLTSPILLPNYRRLPGYMYKESMPEAAVSPQLLVLNKRLLAELGQDAAWFSSPDGLQQLSGKTYDDSNLPFALAYSGHQFGGWSPVLGDGRAHVLGQLKTATGELIDLQLKGSGATPFSRGGDGRATLGAVIREYLLSEAMAGLNISTTGSLAVITTGENVWRNGAYSGAILVRTAKSHLRVGSFQYAAVHQGTEAVKTLADFALAQYYPELSHDENPYQALLGRVIKGQAELVAQWMLVGFIHGVMNTDNSSITGETIDYGPCAFMDEFNPNKVFSSIDSQGRYAWGNQGAIAQWNMARLAETLLPLLDSDEAKALEIAQAQLGDFNRLFAEHFYHGMAKKLSLDASNPELTAFVDSTLQLLANTSVDFCQFFNAITEYHITNKKEDAGLVALFSTEASPSLSSTPAQLLQDWLSQWQAKACDSQAALGAMIKANPKFIARNHKVEAAILAAEQDNDYSLFLDMARVLANPYVLAEQDKHYQEAPTPDQKVKQTFCGT